MEPNNSVLHTHWIYQATGLQTRMTQYMPTRHINYKRAIAQQRGRETQDMQIATIEYTVWRERDIVLSSSLMFSL